MNQYKNILLVLGIIATTLPQISTALDTQANTLINNIKLAYGTTLGPTLIFKQNSPLTYWNELLAIVNSYVKKNYIVAGSIADRDLTTALTGVMNANSRLMTEVEESRKLIKFFHKSREIFHDSRVENPTRGAEDRRFFGEKIKKHKDELNQKLDQFKDIRMRLNTTKAQLAAATFRLVNVSNRENAREVLLTVIELIQRAITSAIDKINEELHELKKDEDTLSYS